VDQERISKYPVAGTACVNLCNPLKLLEVLKIERRLAHFPKRTLLFIDEIQHSPRAIWLLRYFYEERPDLSVIAAGLLLEFALGEVKSFPVGSSNPSARISLKTG